MTRSEAGRLGAAKTSPIRKQAAIDRYNANPKHCLYCTSIIPYSGSTAITRAKKFCNHTCAARYNNPKRKKEHLCFWCSTPTKTGNQYCRLSCFHAKVQAETNANVFTSHLEVRSKVLRRTMLQAGFVYVCAICGQLPKWMDKPLILEADHIDGKSDNNSRSNLRFLCPHCHTQTPTYGVRNRGNGRISRRRGIIQKKIFGRGCIKASDVGAASHNRTEE